jgi:hypothetical protein
MGPLRTDNGDFRDKVVAPDPAAAPADADSEASGISVPAAAADAEDRRQAGIASIAVPKRDPNRAISPDLASRKRGLLIYIIGAAAVVLIAFALLNAAGIAP